ncbi:MAG: tail fiber protein [Pseudolabrys sp.]|nr:tail fiber protein [Pseudolabrys sp.]
MTDTLPLALTGFNYLADINTGMRRTAADTQAIECGGVDIAEFTTTGMSVAGDVDAVSIKQNGAILFPVGGIIPYGGATAPTGWLLCYGQSLLRSDYADLFAAIGTTYGVADGTHFSLPDLRGRLPAGKDDMGGSAASRLTSTTMTPNGNTLGAVGGFQTVTLDTANLPPYTPSGSVSTPTITIGGGSTGITATTGGSGTPSGYNVVQTAPITATSSQPAFSGNAQGGTSAPVNKVQPTLITNYIIFAGV